MKQFKFFQKYASTLPNWYENYVLQKISEGRDMGTSPVDNAYHFEHCGQSKCIIIRSIAFEDENPTENDVFIDYELYDINHGLANEMETHSFNISYVDFIWLSQRYDRF